jgi:hypothetical protein
MYALSSKAAIFILTAIKIHLNIFIKMMSELPYLKPHILLKLWLAVIAALQPFTLAVKKFSAL